MSKPVLMIAYHFPPIRHSSGIQRTLRFATYLRKYGWQPIVLTVHPRAYETTGDDQLADIPDDVIVHRAFALDAKRHLSIRGRHPAFLARPDRYSSWLIGGVIAGLNLVRRHRPRLIWSTYPIATAQLLGYALHRLTALPWVADLRDPMLDDDYPVDPALRRWHRRIENKVAGHASKVVLTSPSARRDYENRYSGLTKDRWVLIPNGYDEEVFAEVERGFTARNPGEGRVHVRMLHSGVLYPSERDPRAFFQALRRLKERGRVSAADFGVALRATGHDDLYRDLLARERISDLVRLEPPIAYRDALREMLDADALLLFQAANCNHQIPAKLYEYLRARRPVLALTDEAGDTAATLRQAGVGTIAPLDDPQKIEMALSELIDSIRDGTAAAASLDSAMKYSRLSLSKDLAGLFDQVDAGGFT